MIRKIKKRNKIIIGLIAAIFLMTVGYAAFQTSLSISSNTNISSLWDIAITNVEKTGEGGSGEQTAAPTFNRLTASMEANLYEKGDYVDYTVTVRNNGNIEAKLTGITNNNANANPAVKISFSGYAQDQILHPNSSMTIVVRIEFDSNYEGAITQNVSGEADVTLNYTQANGKDDGGGSLVYENYLLTYDCTTNGGNACPQNNQYHDESEVVSLSGKTGTKDGYTFIGWNTNPNATTGLSTLTMPSQDTTVYAIYRKTISIVYTRGDNITSIGGHNVDYTETYLLYNNEVSKSITLPSIVTSLSGGVKGWYDSNNTKVGEPNDTYTLTENVTLTAKVSVDPIIKSWSDSANTDFHNSTYRTNITSIEFVDLDNTSLTVPTVDEVTCWDVSAVAGSKSVIAWVTADPNNSGKYILHIGGSGGVIANANSGYLFYNFTAATSINFNDNFDTGNVQYMYSMFEGCSSLTSLDLSNFNTENVTNSDHMFYGCTHLASLDVSSFNTGNVTNMQGMFQNCSSLTSLDLSNFNTENVTDMYNMFRGCSSLTSLDLSNFDTSNVEDMKYMFTGCSGLTSLDVSNFDTGNVQYMNNMFQNCSGLTSLDVSNFDTGNVQYMYNMFSGCTNLETIYASNKFVTNSVTSSSNMFTGDTNLVGGNGTVYSSYHIDKTYAVIDAPGTPGYFTDGYKPRFTLMDSDTLAIIYPSGCTGGNVCTYSVNGGTEQTVTSDTFNLPINDGDVVVAKVVHDGVTSQNTYTAVLPIMKRWSQSNYGDGDYHNSSVTSNIISADFIDIDNTSLTVPTPNNTTSWDVSAAGNGSVIAWVTADPNNSGKYNLHIGGKGGVFVNPEKGNWLFAGLTGLVSVDFTNFNSSNTSELYGIFQDCSSLTTVNLDQLDTSNVTNIGSMFKNCTSLTSVDLSSLDMSENTRLDSMFSGCSNLTSINFGNDFDTSNVEQMEYMFLGCNSLTSLDVSSFDTSNVTNMNSMFSGCSGLTSLDLSNFNTENVTNMGCMFYWCTHLASLDLSSFNTENVTSMSYMLSLCANLTSLDLSSFDTSNVTNMENMFSMWNSDQSTFISNKLASISFGNDFDVSSVTTMSDMFSGCDQLTSLDLRLFNTSNVENMYHMFNECLNLHTIYASSNFVTTNVTNSAAMFHNCTNLVGGNGTAYDTSHKDKTYAVIDAAGTPGYFTDGYKPRFTLMDSDTLAITYPSGCTGGYVCKYSVNGGAEQTVTSDTFSLPVNEGDVVVAKVVHNGVTSQDTYTVAYPIIKQWAQGAATDFHASAYREKITTIEFADDIHIPQGATSWDVSDAGNGSVMAWIIDDPNKAGYYKLYIGGKGGVIANPDNSSWVFESFTALTSIDFNNFDTSNADEMYGLLAGCSSLTSVDLSPLDTGNVTTFGGVFDGCSSLTSVDLSSLDTSNFTELQLLFRNATNLFQVTFGENFDTSNVQNMFHMFEHCNYLTSLDLSMFDTSSAENMAGMFEYCSSLTSLDLSSFDTSNVYDMQLLFHGCSSLHSLDFGENFDTSNVTKMSYMFDQCNDLASLDLSNFDTSKVTTMRYMFSACDSLVSLDLTSFDTSNVTDMTGVFDMSADLSSVLETIYASNKFVTTAVTSSDYMFAHATKLVGGNGTTYDYSHIDKAYAVIDAPGTPGYFTDQYAPRFNLMNNDTLAITYPSGCTGGNVCTYRVNGGTEQTVTSDTFSLPVNEGDVVIAKAVHDGVTSQDTYTVALPIIKQWPGPYDEGTTEVDFHAASIRSKVKSIDFVDNKNIPQGATSWDVSAAGNGSVMAWIIDDPNNAGYYHLYIGGDGGVIGNPTNNSWMLYDFDALTSLNFNENFDTSDVTQMYGLIGGCDSLTSVDVSSLDVSSATQLGGFFGDCTSLQSIDLSSWDTSNAQYMHYMFRGCTYLSSINFGDDFDTSNVENMENMFLDCSSLTSLDLSNFDTSNVTNMDGMFNWCTNLISLNVSSFDTNKVTTMGSMFSNCHSLTSLDVSNFDMGNVENMSYMFSSCRSLTSLDLSNFDTGNVTYTSYMFSSCTNLATIYTSSNFVTTSVNDSENMFSLCTNLVGGNGTTYDSNHIDKAYAVIDAAGTPGYFTYKAFSFNPVINSVNTSATTNSIKVVADASVLNQRNKITKYEFSKDGGTTWIDNDDDNVYIFDNLSIQDSPYQIKVRVTSDRGLITTGTNNSTSLSNLETATFDVDRSGSTKVVTINYPEYDKGDGTTLSCSNGLTCKYIVGSGSEVTVTTSPYDVNVDSEGTVVATVSDGNNMVSSSVTVNVSTMMSGSAFSSKISSIKSSVDTISFVDATKVNVPAINNSTSFDVSTAQDGSVVAYLDDDVLYIASVGGVIANADCSNLFKGFPYLTNISFNGKFDTGSVTNMASMFYGCNGLTSLDLSTFDTSSVTNTNNMFNGCTSLETIYASSDFVTTNITDSTSMFYACVHLVGGNGTAYSQNHVDKTYAVIDTAQTPGYFTDGTDLAPVIHNVNTSSSTNSLNVVVSASLAGDSYRITKYEFSKDGGNTWVNNGKGSAYKFTGLTAGLEYPISVRVTGDNSRTTIYNTNATNLPLPTSDLLFWVQANNPQNTSTTLKDKSINHNDGTLVNFNKTKSSGYNGNDLIFDGVDDYVNMGLANHNFNKTLSFVIYTKINSYSPNATQAFFGNWEGAGGGFEYTAAKRLHFNAHDGSAWNNTAEIDFLDISKYYTFVGTYDGTNVKLYVDGVLVSSQALSNFTTSAVPIALGVNPNASGFGAPTSMSLKEAMLYDRALSAEEVTNITNRFEKTYGVHTDNLATPGYSIANSVASGTSKKTVTINYPTITKNGTTLTCGSGLTCTYVKDGGSAVNVTSSTQTVEFTADGTIAATVSDKDDNNNVINTKSSSYTVTFTKATAPTNSLCVSRTYTGSAQQLTSATSGTGYTLSGYSQTNANTSGYTITATLANGYLWTGGTNGTTTFKCPMAKRTPTITLSAASGSVVKNKTKTFTATVKSGCAASIAGTLRVVSSATSKATVKIGSAATASVTATQAGASKTVTITGVAAGSATITVSFTPSTTTNFNNASNKTYAVTVTAS